jgi:SAM-dependent methyltransferase
MLFIQTKNASVWTHRTVVGVDLREKYIGHARRRAEAEGLPNLTFETGDIRQLPFSDSAFDIVWTKYLLQWVADPMRAMHEFARVLKPGGLLISANFDGFAVTNEPPDPAIQSMIEFVFHQLVDPFIGRRMARMCRDCGLIDLEVKMETDRVFTVIGEIDPERRRNWEIQWLGARSRAAELLGSKALADAFIDKFMAYQDRPDTASYCTLYFVSARKPL